MAIQSVCNGARLLAQRGHGEGCPHCCSDRSGGPRARRPLLHSHPEKDRTAHRGLRAATERLLMFRLSHFLREILAPSPITSTPRSPSGPVVIWNLIRRCNLTCRHCYSISGDVKFPSDLSTAEVFAVMDDLKAFRVPALILSGGEPLMRRDIFEVSERAKAMRFYVG